MSPSKLPFIITGGIVIAGIVGVSQIPYGPQERTIGQQAVDVATQAKDLYVSHPTPEYGVDYDESDMAIATEATRTIPPIPRGDELDELPPDRWKLWDVDPYSLETTGQDYVYLDTSTGKKIVDATEDGYILKIDPSYEVEMRGEKERVALVKTIKEEKCNIAINNSKLVLQDNYEIQPIKDFAQDASLVNIPDELGNIDRTIIIETNDNKGYTITIDYGNPKACYEANLETEVLNAMVFMDPILEKRKFGDPRKFPEPREWPHSKSEVNIYIDEESGKKIVEHLEHGYRIELEPEWQVKPSYDNIEVIASRRCRIFLDRLNEKSLYQERDTESLMKEIAEAALNSSIVISEFSYEKLTDYEFDIYKTIDKSTYSEDIYIGYYIQIGDEVLEITWLDQSDGIPDVRQGQCTQGQYIIDHFSLL